MRSVALALLLATPALAQPTTPIKHVIFIMQENRSFDHYFGAYPGANGIPQGVCVPLNPAQPTNGCVAPYYDPNDWSNGSDHYAAVAEADIDGGAMDGFVQQQILTVATHCATMPRYPGCNGSSVPYTRHDVMAYKSRAELSSYWAYADHFVLQDRFFAAARGFSYPQHLYLTSEWSATCSSPTNAGTCVSDNNPTTKFRKSGALPWVSMFQLLDLHAVSWKFYLGDGVEPDCEDDEMTCAPQIQAAGVSGDWNMPFAFRYVTTQGPAYLTEHNPPLDQLLVDLQGGTLPAVSWLVPNDKYSEHPPASITAGMEYVTSIVNAVMQSPYWQNTAIFISWDDWSGFYDHVDPPIMDSGPNGNLGWGLRVPGLMISAWAKPGFIDDTSKSFDQYNALIEELFMPGQHLDPVAMGNPDARPDIRDEQTQITFPDGHSETIGDFLTDDFDFTQAPLPTLVLNAHIPAGIAISCRRGTDPSATCTKSKVKISWFPLAAGEVPGPFVYHVTRDGVELPQCVGSAATCVDQPPAGTHFYRAYSVDANNVASPVSASAQADAL